VKVVLRTDVDGVGMKGDVIDVADGFGRNKLIPQGLAFKASQGAERQAQGMRRSRELKDALDRSVAEEMATRLVNRPITIAAKAGEAGKLFGSVTSSDVATALHEQANVSIDRKVIQLEDPIKDLGTHLVMVKVHTDVTFPVTVEVIADE
jgi:large subunit ribosomal protein L9